jgi:hypothetical protein
MLEEAKSATDLEIVMNKLMTVASVQTISQAPQPSAQSKVCSDMAPLFGEMFRRLDVVEDMLNIAASNVERVQI